MKFGVTTCYHSPLYSTIQFIMYRTWALILKNIYIYHELDVLKVKLKNFKHTILMKFGRTLAIIVHYTVQFNLEYRKSSVSNMGPNTLKIYI